MVRKIFWVILVTLLLGMGIASAAEPIRFGDEGAEVKALQEQLIKEGYTVSADGDFGSGTEVAVKEFQKARG